MTLDWHEHIESRVKFRNLFGCIRHKSGGNYAPASQGTSWRLLSRPLLPSANSFNGVDMPIEDVIKALRLLAQIHPHAQVMTVKGSEAPKEIDCIGPHALTGLDVKNMRPGYMEGEKVVVLFLG